MEPQLQDSSFVPTLNDVRQPPAQPIANTPVKNGGFFDFTIDSPEETDRAFRNAARAGIVHIAIELFIGFYYGFFPFAAFTSLIIAIGAWMLYTGKRSGAVVLSALLIILLVLNLLGGGGASLLTVVLLYYYGKAAMAYSYLRRESPNL